MLKIKLFDNPIKTEGYCEGVDLLKLFDYETGGYLLLKYKYKHEKEFEEDVVSVEYDMDKGHWIFENDYWEGQEEVYIMGYMNHHYNWDFKDIMTIIKLSTENDILESTIKQLKERNNELKEEINKLNDKIEMLRYLKKEPDKYKVKDNIQVIRLKDYIPEDYYNKMTNEDKMIFMHFIWDLIEKIGDDVIYCDTDSIKFLNEL